MNPLTWQNPGQLFVAQDIIKVKIYSAAELRYMQNCSRRKPAVHQQAHFFPKTSSSQASSPPTRSFILKIDLVASPKSTDKRIFPHIQSRKHSSNGNSCQETARRSLSLSKCRLVKFLPLFLSHQGTCANTTD